MEYIFLKRAAPEAGTVNLHFLQVQRGFTLIEIMVAIAIMAILSAIAIPNFREFSMNNRQVTSLNEYVGLLNYARSEATKRGITVTVCKSADGAACAGGGVNWEDGWMVFQDDNGDGTRDGGDAILGGSGALDAGLTMRGAGPVVNRVTFSSRGYSNNAGTLRFCDSRGAGDARAVVVSTMGRIRLAVDSNADGIVEDGSSVNVSCP